MSDENLRYYEERARQEAEAAEKAAGLTAASAHRLLAIEYEAHAKALRDEAARSRVSELTDA
jgi:hypothetical protein